MLRRTLAALVLVSLGMAPLAQDGAPAQARPAENKPPEVQPSSGFRLAPVVITDLQDTPMGTGVSEPTPFLQTRQRFQSGRDKVLVDIFRPRAAGRYPAVILLHGADPHLGEKHYYEMSEDLARHGYVCLFVRYYDRGRRGRGSRADWTRTIGDALTFACTLPDVDESRLALLGYSLGAFLSLTYAPTDPRVQAVVAYYGGVSPGDMPNAMESMPPTLLLHGTYDRTVPVRRSIDAFQQLRLKAKPVDVVIYPKVGHGFTLHTRGGWDEAVGEDSWERTISFLDFHLKYPAWTPEVPLPEPQGMGDQANAPRQDLFPDLPTLKMPYLDKIDSQSREPVLVNPTPEELKQVTIKAPPARRRSGKKAPPKAGAKASPAKPAPKAAPPAAKK